MIAKLTNISKESNVYWEIARNPYTCSPGKFEEYAQESKNRAVLSDSLYVSINMGYFYIIHYCNKEDMKDCTSIHEVYALKDAKKNFKQDYFDICIQVSHDFPLEELAIPIEYQEQLFVLHQLALRNINSVVRFVDNFINTEI